VLVVEYQGDTITYPLVETFSTFVAVIFAAFATVWSSSLSTRENFASQANSDKYSSNTARSEFRFKRTRGNTTTAGSFDGDIELHAPQINGSNGWSNAETKLTRSAKPVRVMIDWERNVELK
jgi:hypothetical protein